MKPQWRRSGPRLSSESTAALRSRLGEPRWVRSLPSSPRSSVWLAEFNGRPAVVKQVLATGVSGRLAAEVADQRFERELIALRLAARAHPPVVPQLLAGLAEPRLLVLEQLADQRPRTGWVRAWSVALARLHASTGPADVGSLPVWRGPDPQDGQAFLGLAAHLEVPVSDRVPGELGQLLSRLQAAPAHDLLHGDPCPGNDLYHRGAARFIDLEAAGLGPGLVELAYLRIGFPTCWCAIAIGPAELRAAEAGYRRTYRQLTGAEPSGDLTDACAGWLISSDALVERALRARPGHPSRQLSRVTRRDWTWGTATARQRLAHRLDVVAGLCERRDDLVGLGQLCQAMRARITARWRAPTGLPLIRPD